MTHRRFTTVCLQFAKCFNGGLHSGTAGGQRGEWIDASAELVFAWRGVRFAGRGRRLSVAWKVDAAPLSVGGRRGRFAAFSCKCARIHAILKRGFAWRRGEFGEHEIVTTGQRSGGRCSMSMIVGGGGAIRSMSRCVKGGGVSRWRSDPNTLYNSCSDSGIVGLLKVFRRLRPRGIFFAIAFHRCCGHGDDRKYAVPDCRSASRN